MSVLANDKKLMKITKKMFNMCEVYNSELLQSTISVLNYLSLMCSFFLPPAVVVGQKPATYLAYRNV